MAALLAALLGLLPLGALAEGLEILTDDQAVLAEPAEALIPEEELSLGGEATDPAWEDESDIAAEGDFVIDADGVLTAYRGFDANVVIPEGVTALAGSLFDGDPLIETVTIPNTVTSIGWWAFQNCKKLKSVTIPDSVVDSGESWFMGCDALESVKLSASLTALPGFVFCFCPSLQGVDIPAGVTSIEQDAFSHSGLRTLNVPNGVTTIGVNAFEATPLEWIRIPASVTEIDKSAFGENTDFTMLGEPGSYAERFANAMGIPFNAPTVRADRAALLLRMGETRTLTATQIPAELAGQLTWTSSNPAVAAVDQAGNVTAVGAGEASITVSSANGGKPAEVKVFVPQVSTITLTAFGSVLDVGETLTVFADLDFTSEAETNFVYDHDIEDQLPRTLTWSIDRPDVVAFQEGAIQDEDMHTLVALYPGVATVTVTCVDGARAELQVEVAQPKPEAVTLDRTGKVSLKKKAKLALSATLEPAGAQSALTWSSSKPKVASVDQSGNVTALSAGTTKITVKTDNGLSASVTVTVPETLPTKVTLKQGNKAVKKASLKVGKKLTLKAVLSPADAVSKLTWSSSNKKVATVSNKGVVTAKKAGTAKITVKTANGKKATVTVTVKKK